MTTSRRLPLFERTLRSMGQHVGDLDRITGILHLDDGSSPEDVKRMQHLFSEVLPGVPLRTIDDFRFGNRAHHAHIMKTWHDLVSPADWVFHCEDDWEFTRGGPLLGSAIELMDAESSVGQVGFWRKPPESGIEEIGGVRCWKWYHDATVEYVPRAQEEDDIDPAWPHFSLRPCVIRCEALRAVGTFIQDRHFEYHYATRWTARGWETAFLAEKHCRHLAPGPGQSVYEISGTLR